MADTVQITNMQLTPLDREYMTRPMVESGHAWYTLALAVENPSAVTLYAMSGVRRMDYDESRRAMVFELSDHNRVDPERVMGLPPPPPFVAIAPGGEAAITFRLSSPVVFLEESTAGHDRPRFIRIPEDVETIECIVASDVTPPPRDTNLASNEPPPDARGWGHTVQRSLTLNGP